MSHIFLYTHHYLSLSPSPLSLTLSLWYYYFISKLSFLRFPISLYITFFTYFNFFLFLPLLFSFLWNGCIGRDKYRVEAKACNLFLNEIQRPNLLIHIFIQRRIWHFVPLYIATFEAASWLRHHWTWLGRWTTLNDF